MPGLPSELYNRCRTTLLQCSAFNSDAALRAVFVTQELAPFCNGLPGALSPSGRVDAGLAYLLPKRLSDGRAVLPLFIAALRDRYMPGDALHDDLNALYQAVQSAMTQSQPRPTQRPGAAQPNWDTSTIRALLTAAFDDQEVTTLCFDHFRSVYDDFGSGMSKGQKIQCLLAHCVRHSQVEKLMSLVRAQNPTQYAHFEGRLK